MTRFGQMLSFVSVLLLLSAGPVRGRAQQRSSGTGMSQQGGSGSAPFPSRGDQEDPGVIAVRETQARARNDERQKRLVSDTDKLLALATQLHADVAKTDRNILSLDVVRRCEEMEKLAHAIKERMKS